MDGIFRSSVYRRMMQAGDNLKGKLPPSPRHPKGRNSHAHIAKTIINTFGKSYRDLTNDQYEAVMAHILKQEKKDLLRWQKYTRRKG